jgi:hypothetical protein
MSSDLSAKPSDTPTDFLTLVDTGHIYEEVVKHIFAGTFDKYIQPKGKFSEYDLDLIKHFAYVLFGDDGYKFFNDAEPEDTHHKIEVKAECSHEKWGNVAIEYYNTNDRAPTGIGITTADTWISVLHTFGSDYELIPYVQIPTQTLKDLIAKGYGPGRPFRKTTGGNFGYSLLHLIPKTVLKPWIKYFPKNKLPIELIRRIESIKEVVCKPKRT